MKDILNIENLSIGYIAKKQNTIIAADINVTVNQPKFIALLGRNGVGKSTLFRTIASVQPMINGTIFINNKNITDYNSVELSKEISVVLTERIPLSNLTVYELIALGRQVYTNWIGTITAHDKLMIENAINQVNIIDLSNKKIDELSDGQYQKVMIARALAQDTSIILLDEPTAHLDIINKVEIFKLLNDLVIKKGKTIIVSSHEIQLCLQFTNDLWLMTEEEFISGNTNNLTVNNSLNKVFKSKHFVYNHQTRQFDYN